MPNVVKPHLLVKPYLSAFEPIVMLLPVYDVFFLLPSVYDLPQSELLSRGLVFSLLKEYLRSYGVSICSIFFHLHVILDPPQCEV